jgi:hypothetical protein
VSKLRSENEMLMEHLVSVKIRSAEVHGDYLEARRELLRTREKQLQVRRSGGGGGGHARCGWRSAARAGLWLAIV